MENRYYELGVSLAVRRLHKTAANNDNPKKKEENSSWLNWAAPLGAAAGLGLGAYGLARYPMLANVKKWPILRKIQEMSKGDMLSRGVRGAPEAAPAAKGVRAARQLAYGPEMFGQKLPKGAKGGKGPKAVWHGEGAPVSGSFDPALGPVTGRKAKMHSDMVAILEDKANQAAMLSKHAPGTSAKTISIEDVLKKYKLKLRKGKNLKEDLGKLQKALKREYRDKDFVIKPSYGDAASSGKFPTSSTDLHQAHSKWKKMAPEMEQLSATADHPNTVIEAFRTKPGYEGRVVDSLLERNAIIQEKLPLLTHGKSVAKKMTEKGLGTTKEYRTHVVGGKVVPSLATPRYFSSGIRTPAEMIRARSAAKWLQKEVVDKLPKEYKNLSYGVDVAPIQGGGYRVIEMNPGGMSGLLDQPGMRHALHKAVTGRHTVPVAAGIGLGAASLGAAGTSAAVPD